MPISEWVNLFHWVVYLFSILTFVLLLTPWRMWGAAWIAFLFFTQALFHGCVLIDIQNHFRVLEGSPPIRESMLTASFTSSIALQILFTWMIVVGALIIVIGDVWVAKNK